MIGSGVAGALLLAAGLVTDTIQLLIPAATGLLSAGLMLHSSFRGKLRERDRLLDHLALEGDERLLDLGCGRGLLLVGAAKRLHLGHAIGVDLWRDRDQGANSRAATLNNAAIEEVAERVVVMDGDLRALPFPAASFDVAVACLALHNISDPSGRATAVREAARVLKPGGRVALLDFRSTKEYVRTLDDLAFSDVRRTGLRLAMYPPVRTVTARKPTSDHPAG